MVSQDAVGSQEILVRMENWEILVYLEQMATMGLPEPEDSMDEE